MTSISPHVVIVGGGFTGLSAAHDLVRTGHRVTILEADSSLGGLAGGFDVGGHSLERFYHHWFTNDRYVVDLVAELGLREKVVERPTRTGMYFAKSFFKLSSPIDLLRFTPLAFPDRIRLGLLALRARAVKDWKPLENMTAREWLIGLAGERVYKVVWEPLLVGKFGPFADAVSAVWFWKKIALRGSSRGNKGQEMLAYYEGGFAALSNAIGASVGREGATIRLNAPVSRIVTDGGRATGVEVAGETIAADAVLLTPALPIVADLLHGSVTAAFEAKLRRVQYLANVCLVLELDRSLSETYWLNVNDPTFPFVGIIEHTNFEPPESYGGSHIIYLSKYLPETDALYTLGDDALLDFAVPHVTRMFPKFDRSWVIRHHVWRAAYAQPIMEKHYSEFVPGRTTPLGNVFVSTMAQVYPEDRGTNYAIREGRQVAAQIGTALAAAPVRVTGQAERAAAA